MPKERLIKKYANRRLYDASISKHVTLADIRQLIVDGEKIRVIEDKTNEDITRLILLQVIAEQEGTGGEPLMSRDFLSQVIRSYGSGLQDFVGRYLDESLNMFVREQRELRERFKSVVGLDPLEHLTAVAEKNHQRWKALQEEVFSRLPRTPWSRDEDER